MTTIISQNLTFVAADRLWTDCNDNPAPPPFKKFYILDDSIIFYSGYINAILAILAFYIGDNIGIDEEYATLIGILSNMDEDICEFIEVDRTNGEVVYFQGAITQENGNYIFYGAGSGSEYAIECYINSIQVITINGHYYDFIKYGDHFIKISMDSASTRDRCSGGGFDYIKWLEEDLIIDKLNWLDTETIEQYNQKILDLIRENCGNKKELSELISMMDDERERDQEELEREIKSIDSLFSHEHNPIKDPQLKGDSRMNDSTKPPTRVAVKTSGANRGVILDIASIKNRIAKRKATRS
ncbi:hypothetical protein [Proteus sp. CD3]|uniref:hypothetical protein n=1 Tax=Proteus sp. CD3 TaxID=1921565 RepID=UPI00124A7C31|nr:hypothetical protein [Proteus sp. CD3]QEZ91209.1 hypothetical protein BTA34_02100 [Proteus sp. CD3]